jgi:hypothetical protein
MLDREVLPYMKVARPNGHQVNIVLTVLPDGKVGSPKVTVDTRGDTRNG